MFAGIALGCDCIDRNLESFFGQPCRKGKNQPHNSEDCWPQPAHAPVVMNMLSGAHVCGRRGGPSFDKVVRNQDLATGGSCPAGYQHCGQRTTPTPEHTLCLPAANVTAGECPIVDVQSIGSSQASQFRSRGYTVVSGAGLTLAYSKEPTALPI